MTDFAARAFPASQRRIDADSENVRDLRERVSLNLFQQKHVAFSLTQLESPEDRRLERARTVKFGRVCSDWRPAVRLGAASNCMVVAHRFCANSAAGLGFVTEDDEQFQLHSRRC